LGTRGLGFGVGYGVQVIIDRPGSWEPGV
jgi:hypothetical protein